MLVRGVTIAMMLLALVPAFAQTPEDAAANRLFVEAVQLWNRAPGEPVGVRAMTLRRVQSNLKAIIEQHPGSALAVRLVIGETVGPLSRASVTAGVTQADADLQAENARVGVGRVFRDCAECPELVIVRAGAASLGSGVEVIVPEPVAIGRFEVTIEEWDACRDENWCKNKEIEQCRSDNWCSEFPHYGGGSWVETTFDEFRQIVETHPEYQLEQEVPYAENIKKCVSDGACEKPQGPTDEGMISIHFRVFIQLLMWEINTYPDKVKKIEESTLDMRIFDFSSWKECVALGSCNFVPLSIRRSPVVRVSWEDAQQYVAWLSHKTGKQYRMLSEAEWEYAAQAESSRQVLVRAGTNAANCRDCLDKKEKINSRSYSSSGSVPVGSFSANAFGLHDMLGNVAEWTADCWAAQVLSAPSTPAARTGDDCEKRVIRGGHWLDEARDIGSARRRWSNKGYNGEFVGFRVARNL